MASSWTDLFFNTEILATNSSKTKKTSTRKVGFVEIDWEKNLKLLNLDLEIYFALSMEIHKLFNLVPPQT